MCVCGCMRVCVHACMYMYVCVYVCVRARARVCVCMYVRGRPRGLVVSVLATGAMVRGFKPGRGRWICKGDKIRSTSSFGGKSCMKKTLRRQNSAAMFLTRVSPASPLDVSGGFTTRCHWWPNQGE
jgi:hypothetical protein